MSFVLLLACFSPSSHAEEEALPLWEYGAGFGFVRYEHYPASDQFSELYLPFPTFQYRGDILRADDQEGASLYFFRKGKWSVELSGGGYLPLESSKNRAREGMEDLPVMGMIGPQLVYRPSSKWELSLNTFQTVSVDGSFIKKNGFFAEAKAHYRWEKGRYRGQWGLSVGGASKEFLTTYFEVDSKDVKANRPGYYARAGLLNADLSYFQSIFFGDFSLYVGAALSDYTASANRRSPLHKSDHNVSYLIGATYTIGKSSTPAVKVEETKGLFRKREAGGYYLVPFDR